MATEMKSNDSVAKPGLADLDRVTLSPQAAQQLKQAADACGGDPAWRARKLAEALDLLAMGDIAPRMRITHLDLRESLRAAIHLWVPVACRKHSTSPLHMSDSAVLGLTYREEAMRTALPGYAFFEVLMPRHCWSASISADAIQALCLGASLPAGIRCKELVVMAYGALAMQTVQIDLLDPAGVMNSEAALWWQDNVHRVPLTKAPFLSDRPA